MAKDDSLWIAIGLLGLGGLGFWHATKRKKQPPFFVPGDTVDAVQGQMFTLRLPRAESYEVTGTDGLLVVVAENDIGLSTDLAIAVKAAAQDYVVTPTFVPTDRPGTAYRITVSATRNPNA